MGLFSTAFIKNQIFTGNFKKKLYMYIYFNIVILLGMMGTGELYIFGFSYLCK